MEALTVDFKAILDLSDEQFYQLCRSNPNIKFERSSTGELILIPPTGGETGKSNFEIAVDLGIWNRQNKLGIAFDSSTCFKLPNGADRSPDASWIKLERWNNLTSEQKEKFPPICPDFVIELLSPSDSLTATQEKMKEYKSNGACLGWLINRKTKQVEIYRIGQEVEVLDNPTSLSGEDVLPGFILNLAAIW
ncbi:MAG: Uma2 family endonuclease [Calothrix sp. C42_A2020_038]|nr:Uma2 family endonuclease [Calothrix sp. C42_A2020_038]